MDEDFFDHVMKLNMNTVFLATQAVVPHMPAGSAIVNLASLAGRDGGGGGALDVAAGVTQVVRGDGDVEVEGLGVGDVEGLLVGETAGERADEKGRSEEDGEGADGTRHVGTPKVV